MGGGGTYTSLVNSADFLRILYEMIYQSLFCAGGWGAHLLQLFVFKYFFCCALPQFYLFHFLQWPKRVDLTFYNGFGDPFPSHCLLTYVPISDLLFNKSSANYLSALVKKFKLICVLLRIVHVINHKCHMSCLIFITFDYTT